MAESRVDEVPGGFDAPGQTSGSMAAAIADGQSVEGMPSASFALPNFNAAAGKKSGGAPGTATDGPIEMLKDVDLNVKIELGRTRMLIEDVLRLAEGSVVELDKLAGDPV